MQQRIEKIKSYGVYTIASSIKVILGLGIMILTLSQLNVREDPEIAITMLLVGSAVLSWWVAYFVFWGGQELFLIDANRESVQKLAYKCSLLFGIYTLINVILFVFWWWNRWWGLFFLLVFIMSQVVIFNPWLIRWDDR